MKKSIFEQQVEHYTNKFNSTFEEVMKKDLSTFTKLYNFNSDNLEAELRSNSEAFRRFAYNIASSLVVGKISCTSYAVAVAYLAAKLNIPYSVYTGFCLPKSHPRFDKEVADFNAKKSAENPHPIMATHVYTEIDGVPYEYYNGETSNIEHIDCVKIH